MSLTRGGLSYLIKAPDQLVSFIREAFKLKNGSRISRARAIGFAANVCAHFLPRGTCAVALPAVPRCTQRPRLINVAVPFHIVFGFPAEPPGRVVLLASRCVSPCSPVRMNTAVPWHSANYGRCDALGAHLCPPTTCLPRGPAAHSKFAREPVAGLKTMSGTPAGPMVQLPSLLLF